MQAYTHHKHHDDAPGMPGGLDSPPVLYPAKIGFSLGCLSVAGQLLFVAVLGFWGSDVWPLALSLVGLFIGTAAGLAAVIIGMESLKNSNHRRELAATGVICGGLSVLFTVCLLGLMLLMAGTFDCSGHTEDSCGGGSF